MNTIEIQICVPAAEMLAALPESSRAICCGCCPFALLKDVRRLVSYFDVLVEFPVEAAYDSSAEINRGTSVRITFLMLFQMMEWVINRH